MIIKKSRVKYNFKKLLQQEVLIKNVVSSMVRTPEKRTDTSKLEFD